MPLARSIIFGVITAVILGCATVLLIIGEMDGAIDLRVLLILTVSASILAGAFTKPKGWWRGLAAGLVFALPVAATCFVIPAIMLGQTSHPAVTQNKKELRFVGITTAVIAGVLLGLRGVDYRESSH